MKQRKSDTGADLFPMWMKFVLFTFFVFCSILFPIYFSWDQNFWLHWTDQILLGGIGSVYTAYGCNYPPLIFYILFIWGKWSQLLQVPLADNFGALRTLVFAFDILTLGVFAQVLAKLKLRTWPVLLLIFNVGWLYNSLIWRQVDAIFSFLILVSLYCLLSKRLSWATVFYVLAINAKVQSVVFLPLFVLGLLAVLIEKKREHHTWVKPSLRLIVETIFIAGLAQTLLLLPFILNGTVADALTSITQAVDYYPIISANAHNFWLMLLGEPRMSGSDTQLFWQVSYKHWGYVLFCTASFFTLLPAAIISISKGEVTLREKWEVFSASTALTFAAFFLFNTQMHERYIHPAIVFCGLFAVVSRKKWAFVWYVLWSALYFMNLEWVNFVWRFIHYKSPDYVSRIFVLSFICVLLCFYYSYQSLLKTILRRRSTIVD